MINKPKGTYDVNIDNGRLWSYVEDVFKSVCTNYNYNYVRTPIFEASELFHRGIGETSDIVSKETYDFIDKGNRNMTLRPELTAGMIRSFIENKYVNTPIQPVKLFSFGPCFRYERSQRGRFREFYQGSIEVLGSNSPLIDAETISLAVNYFKFLGLEDLTVKINTLGSNEDRIKYKEALINHFRPVIGELCDDCKIRLEKNPLRILDCKKDREHPSFKSAPSIYDYLDETSTDHFNQLQIALSMLEVDFTIDDKLVRGFDYYNHTVFEIENPKGDVLAGGGRYDGLSETLGGPKAPGFGVGIGIERLIMTLVEEGIDPTGDNTLDGFIINIGNDVKPYTLAIANSLRMSGFKIDLDFLDKSLPNQFKLADRHLSKLIVIIGDDEVNNQTVKIKNTDSKEEVTISIHEIIDYFIKHTDEGI